METKAPYTATTDIAAAKRLIAATSPEGGRLLGAGVSGPCSQARYNRAAEAALSDSGSGLTPQERRLIASHILPVEAESGVKDRALQIRVSAAELEQIQQQAAGRGLSASEYVRWLVERDAAAGAAG